MFIKPMLLRPYLKIRPIKLSNSFGLFYLYPTYLTPALGMPNYLCLLYSLHTITFWFVLGLTNLYLLFCHNCIQLTPFSQVRIKHIKIHIFILGSLSYRRVHRKGFKVNALALLQTFQLTSGSDHSGEATVTRNQHAFVSYLPSWVSVRHHS